MVECIWCVTLVLKSPKAEESVATSSVGRNAVGVSASPNWSVPQRAATEASSITM